MVRACDAIVGVLIEAGVDHVFGIPGGGTAPIWDALYTKQDRIKVILTRHEQSAACMADAYGRLTGKPALLMGQGAFIASNGAFGILESYLYGSPMLVITDTSEGGLSQHGTMQSGSGEYGSFDIVNIMRGMTKYTTYAVSPEEAVHGVQLALKHSLAGRPGPASVVMRSTAAISEISPIHLPRLHDYKWISSDPYQPHLYLRISGRLPRQSWMQSALSSLRAVASTRQGLMGNLRNWRNYSVYRS